MSRLINAVLGGFCLLFAGPTMMIAQSRTYDDNALRVEFQTGDARIVRGISGTVVAKVRSFRRTDLEQVVSGSPQAIAEAKIFERDYRPGSIVAGLGIAALGVALGVSRIQDINPTIPTVLMVVSLTSLSYGGMKLHSAYAALSKAVWWYNRDMTR